MSRDLEFEYSPSKNVKRFATPEEVIASHLKFAKEESDLALNEVEHDLNISYGDGENEKFDYFYGEHTKSDAPVFVYLHGGYWQDYGLTKDNSRYCVRPLVQNGFRVIIVDYDICPMLTLENLVERIQKAARTILEHASNVTAKKVIFAGHSAGAHLCTYLFTQKFLQSTPHAHLLKAFFLISGVYDLTELYETSVNKDNIFAINEKSAKDLSPVYDSFAHLKNYDFEIRIYVGEYDTDTFIEQSQDLAAKLKVDGANTVYRILYDFDHFNIVEDLALDWFYITKDIFATLNA